MGLVVHGCAHQRTTLDYPNILCSLSFRQQALCPVQLAWPKRRQLTVRAEFCPNEHDQIARRMAHDSVGVCLPFFLTPSVPAAQEALQRLQRWLRFMTNQVDRIHLHVLNRGEQVAPAVRDSPILHAHYWSYFEDGNQTLNARSHLGNQNLREPGRISAYHCMPMVYTKCVLEASTEWVVFQDMDEYWKSLPPAPQLTMREFLARVPRRQQQYHFCTTGEDECLRRTATAANMYRPKSAVRVGSRKCDWVGSVHFGVPFPIEGQPSECAFAFRRAGGRFDWVNFSSFCTSSPLAYYMGHESARLGTGNSELEMCETAARQWELRQWHALE